MSRTLLTTLVVLLAFFVIADSWYLYESAVTDTALICDIGEALDGCNIVAQSEYSKLFGQPLALYGLVFFALMFVLGGAVSVWKSRLLYQALLGLSALSALASVAFLYIQFVLIKALCIYCIGSALAAFLLLWVSWALWKRSKAPAIPAM